MALGPAQAVATTGAGPVQAAATMIAGPEQALGELRPGWGTLQTVGEREGDVYVGAKVLPMGWSSAVGVLQHAHRRLALRSPLTGAGLLGHCEIRRDAIFPDLEKEDALWSLYLHDSNLIEVMTKKVAKEMEGRPSEEQEHLRRAYRHWGIPVSLDKALVRASSAEKLGAVIDGDGPGARASAGRLLAMFLLVHLVKLLLSETLKS